MCRLNTAFRKAMLAKGYTIRSRTITYGHREYQFASANGSFTIHIPDCCPKCHQETGGIPWKQYSALLMLGKTR